MYVCVCVYILLPLVSFASFPLKEKYHQERQSKRESPL